jgi:D-alanyl-D-alanine carboxypeptidase
MTPARLLALLVVLAGAAGGLFAAGVLSSGSGGADARSAARAVPHLDPVVGPTELQRDLGPLPAPAGASQVDLSVRSLMSHLRLKRGPKAGLAFDLADGTVLWRRRATTVRPVASLTKLMTALLAVERFEPGDSVRVPRAADQVGGSRMAGLVPGRHVRADVLLKGLLISSSNNAAVTLAVAGAGSERAWVALMNKRAELLGLTCTHFVDAHGLDPRDRSCAADLAVLAMRAMNEPRITQIARKSYARVWPGSGKKFTLYTTNHLLREHYPGAIGLKTGYTNPAGHCLVAIVERGNRRIGVILLGAHDAFRDARRIAREAARIGALPAAS